MATANPPRRTLRWGLALAAAAALLAALWLIWGERYARTAQAGVAYGARVACACRFVAGRSLEDCGKDRLAGMGMVRFSEDAAARSVTASVPVLARDTATYTEGYGCLLQPYTD